MIDPYLSNSLFDKRGDIFKRLVPINEKYFDYDIDILFISHNHEDHMNLETLERLFLQPKTITVLCPNSVYEILKPKYGNHSFILFNPGVEVSINNILFKAIYAEHEDINAVGTCIEIDNKTIYITGDTLYTNRIFDFIKFKIDVLIVCINGVGNNMNYVDAARLTNKIKPSLAIPCHYDMFEKFGENPKNYLRLIDEDIESMLLNNGMSYTFK